jgi:hypothetical protein
MGLSYGNLGLESILQRQGYKIPISISQRGKLTGRKEKDPPLPPVFVSLTQPRAHHMHSAEEVHPRIEEWVLPIGSDQIHGVY